MYYTQYTFYTRTFYFCDPRILLSYLSRFYFSSPVSLRGMGRRDLLHPLAATSWRWSFQFIAASVIDISHRSRYTEFCLSTRIGVIRFSWFVILVASISFDLPLFHSGLRRRFTVFLSSVPPSLPTLSFLTSLDSFVWSSVVVLRSSRADRSFSFSSTRVEDVFILV